MNLNNSKLKRILKMKIKLKTAHEEEVLQNKKKYIIGVLTIFDEKYNRRLDSYLYYFNENNIINNEGVYIFFNSFMDLMNFLYYGEKKIKRAYMSESKFDEYYDNGIEGTFEEKLNWKNN